MALSSTVHWDFLDVLVIIRCNYQHMNLEQKVLEQKKNLELNINYLTGFLEIWRFRHEISTQVKARGITLQLAGKQVVDHSNSCMHIHLLNSHYLCFYIFTYVCYICLKTEWLLFLLIYKSKPLRFYNVLLCGNGLQEVELEKIMRLGSLMGLVPGTQHLPTV